MSSEERVLELGGDNMDIHENKKGRGIRCGYEAVLSLVLFM